MPARTAGTCVLMARLGRALGQPPTPFTVLCEAHGAEAGTACAIGTVQAQGLVQGFWRATLCPPAPTRFLGQAAKGMRNARLPAPTMACWVVRKGAATCCGWRTAERQNADRLKKFIVIHQQYLASTAMKQLLMTAYPGMPSNVRMPCNQCSCQPASSRSLPHRGLA